MYWRAKNCLHAESCERAMWHGCAWRGQSGVMRTRQDRWSGEPGRGRGVIICSAGGAAGARCMVCAVLLFSVLPALRCSSLPSEWRKRRLFGRAGEGVVHRALSLSHQHPAAHTAAIIPQENPPAPRARTLQPGESNFAPPVLFCSICFYFLSLHNSHLCLSSIIFIHAKANIPIPFAASLYLNK